MGVPKSNVKKTCVNDFFIIISCLICYVAIVFAPSTLLMNHLLELWFPSFQIKHIHSLICIYLPLFTLRKHRLTVISLNFKEHWSKAVSFRLSFYYENVFSSKGVTLKALFRQIQVNTTYI